MRFKLWKQFALSLLLPSFIAVGIVIYAIYDLTSVSRRVAFIETADDINITLLELRRYEKNILLFREDENINKFEDYLLKLEEGIKRGENEVISELGKQKYRTLFENLKSYKEAAGTLTSNIRTERKLLESIRPLGRAIEQNSFSKEKALELRRQEKNYIIYREQDAIRKLRAMAKQLAGEQPSLKPILNEYLHTFDLFLSAEGLKEASIGNIRDLARAMQVITGELSTHKRNEIEKAVTNSRSMLLAAFLFLVLSAIAAGCNFSVKIVSTLKKLEHSLTKLRKGDFNSGIDFKGNLPEEVVSLTQVYNQAVDDLRMSRAELEKTLENLADINRELIEKQDELVEARKLTAMRLLASEIAHEINNPLSTLTTFLGVLYEDTKGEPPSKEVISLMLKDTRRCQAVLRELVDFARKEPLRLKMITPARLITESIEGIGKDIKGKNIQIETRVRNLPDKAVLDPVLINQALINILSNAYDFTPPGGTIAIDGHAEGGAMVLSIKDTGEGISPEDLPYVFEPFFSTRKDAGGSGLGLAISKKIIERHNGSIKVESVKNSGTLFTITLPLKRENT